MEEDCIKAIDFKIFLQILQNLKIYLQIPPLKKCIILTLILTQNIQNIINQADKTFVLIHSYSFFPCDCSPLNPGL